VLGAWASVRKLEHRDGKHYTGEQSTRLGNPLINELFIGTTYKNEWNARHPSGDERYNEFILNPFAPAYIEKQFDGLAGATVQSPKFPRVDLIAVFHQGVPGLNKPSRDSDDDDEVFADLLRMSISNAAWVDCDHQNPMGVIGGDAAGYPNGRRLGDDIVDIILRAGMGKLCDLNAAAFCGGQQGPSGSLTYTDQAPVRACMFKCDPSGTTDGHGVTIPGSTDFPFLNPPIPGNALFNPSSGLLNYHYSQWEAGCRNRDTPNSHLEDPIAAAGEAGDEDHDDADDDDK